MPIVHPIHTREGEVVDIHWHLKDGTVFIERRDSPPPKATREAKANNTDDRTADGPPHSV